jgi:DNA-binding beta-propeller fold protein YncE
MGKPVRPVALALLQLVCAAYCQTLERTIHVGDTLLLPSEPFALAYDSRDKTVFIGGLSSDSILVLDEKTVEPLGWIDVGAPTSILAYCPGLSKLYSLRQDGFSAFDASTHALLASAAVPLEPLSYCLDSVDNKLYFYDDESAAVMVLDCNTDRLATVARDIRRGYTIPAICYVPGWSRVYCCDYLDSAVVVIDCRVDTVLARAAVPQYAIALCYNEANGRVYVMSDEDGGPFGIDVATNAVVSTADCFYGAWLCCNPRGNKLYGCNAEDGGIGVYDCSTDSILAMVYTESEPDLMFYSPSANKVYATDQWG